MRSARRCTSSAGNRGLTDALRHGPRGALRNGLFIETALPLAIGTELDVDLVIPVLAVRSSVRGRVVRRVPPGPGSRPGVGLALVDAPGSHLLALHELAGLFRRRPLD